MTAPNDERFVGIDVAKAWLDIAVVPGGETWRVTNDEAGWDDLGHRLQALSPTLIVLEATGGYECGVTLALDTRGLTPVVANPLATRRFAQSLGRRAKTDACDAAMLAHFGQRVRPAVRPVVAATARAIQDVLDRHRQLTKMSVEEQNRLQQASPLLQPMITDHIAALKADLKAIDALMAAVVAGDPAWQARVDLLDTVPGIAALTATTIAVGLPELGQVSSKQIAALVGVAPFAQESGTHRSRRDIVGGRRHVRQALYQAMLTTIRCDPTMHQHYTQLRATGKVHKLAMIACVRRLLGILTAMVRDGLTWQQTHVGQGAFLEPAA